MGIGLGGEEARYPPEKFAGRLRARARGGLRLRPHAGEVAGPASVRGALDALGMPTASARHPRRRGHQRCSRSSPSAASCSYDASLEPAGPGVVRSLAEHPLPELVAAGIPCTVSTDDPEMFDTDLTREYEAALSLGVDPQAPLTTQASRVRSAVRRRGDCARLARPTTGRALSAEAPA